MKQQTCMSREGFQGVGWVGLGSLRRVPRTLTLVLALDGSGKSGLGRTHHPPPRTHHCPLPSTHQKNSVTPHNRVLPCRMPMVPVPLARFASPARRSLLRMPLICASSVPTTLQRDKNNGRDGRDRRTPRFWLPQKKICSAD